MKSLPVLVACCLLLAVFAAPACRKSQSAPVEPTDSDSTATIRPVLDPIFLDSGYINGFLSEYPLFSYHAQEIRSFYTNRNYQAAWFNAYGLIEQCNFFLNQLEHFDEEGLKDTVIYYSAVKKRVAHILDPNYIYANNDTLLPQLELLLTAEFFVYAQKVWYGISEKTTRSLDWYVTRKTIPSVSLLDSLLQGGKNIFTSGEPIWKQYASLKSVLKQYRALSEEPWDSIALPEGIKSIKPGESYSVIPEIKRRLNLLGDLAANDSTTIYDSTTLIAAKHFQYRHGLTEDGEMGSKFFREINISPAERAHQIELNMERCRWLPETPEGNYFFVNIPEYTMRIYDHDTLAWDMRVVVGATSTSTTIFNDELEYIVFSPYWIPPPSILNNEILPALKKDPKYLQKQHMEAFNPATNKAIDVSGVDWKTYSTMPCKVRQLPGEHCALGWVKFLFPNEHNIYFHDTPSRELFSRESRGFSHGCIRLQQPKELAKYLLRNDSTYTDAIIDSLYYLGRETYVTLPEKIPVYIVYFTALVHDDGTIHFSRDIYGHDAKLDKTLNEEAWAEKEL